MNEHMTPERIANAILMMKSSDKIFHLILEGKIDCKVYPKFFDKEKTHISCAFGYENILAAMARLEEEEIKENVLGIIDADFRRVLNQTIDNPQILLTDYHDIESMIINSNVLNLFTDLYIKKPSSISKISGGKSIKEHAYEVSKTIALLRFLNYVEDDEFGLRFKELTYSKMINVSDLKIIDLILDNSNRKNQEFKMSDKPKILERYDEYKKENYDDLQFVNGHDLMNVIKESLNKILRKDNSTMHFNEVVDLENTLCMAYLSSSEFYSTNIFSQIRIYLETKGYLELLVP
ncbi:DUF4435 domain-containing protein [Trichococcus collinsii]|uniref:DUF4435 domain-containing protein n=1 Tax=Trichococcus collinsii TaxID=157076 RepID=A0AB38A427_9LACT|nr:DUF4435 domain-containing protein [Trichococcus collinsii]CZQ97881.1 Hypothetical protein Tcol_1577 [Trichococcus collinsii]SEA97070.1 Protein of unknown function [Trichococcus collinsii]